MDTKITQQVRDELETVERMNYGQVKTSKGAEWKCSTEDCDTDEFVPALVPGDEDEYPRCPECHETPAASDVVVREGEKSLKEKWSGIFDRQ